MCYWEAGSGQWMAEIDAAGGSGVNIGKLFWSTLPRLPQRVFGS